MDYTWIWVWLGVTAVSLIIEFIVMDMVTVWFVAGGIVSMVLAAVRVPVEVQITVFVVLSMVLLLSLRKISLKYLLKNSNEKTNLDLNIGKIVVLKEKISPTQNGVIRLNGVDWTAVCVDEATTINEGERVEVVELKGNKFFVKVVSKKEDKEKEVLPENKETVKKPVEAKTQKPAVASKEKSTKITNTSGKTTNAKTVSAKKQSNTKSVNK